MNINVIQKLQHGSLMTAFCVAGVLIPAAWAAAAQPMEAIASSDSSDAGRVVLDNGITVLLCPIEGADRVAVESLYRVGFLHEPKGMPQVTHLLEHLVCQCATSGYAAGESFALLNSKGQANAETLADFTHYDYVVPATDLELVLRIEAERLTDLRIERAAIEREAPKCYAEADAVERNPRAGMTKHAFMAFGQAWGHGARTARIRGGLEEIPVDDLKRLHARCYHPGNLVLAIAGGFERGEAIKLVEDVLGGIPASRAAPPRPPAWARVREKIEVRWDSKVRAVCIAYPPPEKAMDRLALSLWGNLLMQKLMSDKALMGVADAVFASNQNWSVGTLPFFVYATAKPGVAVSRVQGELARGLEAALASMSAATDVMSIRFMAGNLARSPELTWKAVQRQAKMLSGRVGVDVKRASGMVLGSVALQRGFAELPLGAEGSQGAERLGRLTSDELQRIQRRCFDTSRRFVTVLLPATSAPRVR